MHVDTAEAAHLTIRQVYKITLNKCCSLLNDLPKGGGAEEKASQRTEEQEVKEKDEEKKKRWSKRK